MEPHSPRRQLAEESKLDHLLVEEARGATQALCSKQKRRVARSWTMEANRLLASSSSEAESDADTEENSPRKTNSPRTLKGKLQRAQTELVTVRHGRRRRRELGSSSSLLHSEREHTAHRAQELRRQNQELTHAVQAQKAARERANAQTEALKHTLKQEWEEKTALMARYRADVKAIEHKLQKVRSACKDANLRVELAQEAQMRAEIERDRAREESNKQACALEATQDTVLAQTAELHDTRARLCSAKKDAAQLAETVASLENANQALSDKLDTVRTELQDLNVQFYQQSIQVSLQREESQILDEKDTSILQTKRTPSQVCQESQRQRGEVGAQHQELGMTRHEAASSSTDIASATEETLPVQRQLESRPDVRCCDCKQNDDEHEQKDATCMDKDKEWEKKLLAIKQEEQRTRDKLCEDYEDKIANLTKECQTWREDTRSKSHESRCELDKLREEYEKKLLVLTETSKGWQKKAVTAHEEGQCKLENIRKGYEVKITLLTNECKHWQEEASRKHQASQCEIEALRADYEATVATLTKECAQWQEEALSESQKAHLHQRELRDEYESKLVSLTQERQALQKEARSLRSALLAIQSDREAQPRASDIVALETKYWRAIFARTVASLPCATLTSKESRLSDSATTTAQAPFDAWRECSALRVQLNECARVLAERDVQLEELGQRKSSEEKLRQELVASEQEVVRLRSELAAASARAEFETAQHRELVVKAASLESRLKDRVHQLEAECAQLADKTAASQDSLLKLQVCHEKTCRENEKLKRKANLAARSNANLLHNEVQPGEIRTSRRRSKKSSSQTMDRGLGDENNDQKKTLAADNFEKPEIVLPQALKVLELTRKQLSRERVRLTLATIAALSARDRFERLREDMYQLEESNSYRSAECCASPCAECAATQVMLVDAVREKKRLAAQLAHEMQLREAHTQKIDKNDARRKMLVGDLERALADRDEARAALERAHAYQKRFDRDKSKLEAKIDALEIELQTQREQVAHLTQNKQDQGVVIAALEREMQVHHECLEATQEEAARVVGVLKDSQHLARSRLLALQRQETELDCAKEELLQRNERIRNVEKELATVQEQCAEQERQFASRESALLEEIGVGQNRLSATLEELHARQLALETSKETQERLKIKLSQAESASTHREGARQRAAQLEQHLHTKQLQVDTLTSQVQQMEREIARHAEIAASRLGRVETLQSELDAVAQAHTRSEADLEAAMEDLALATSKGSRLEEAVNQARDACVLAEDARGELVQRSELLETDVRGLRAENKQLRECLRTSRMETKVLAGVQKSLAARDAELALAQRQNVDYAQRIAELEARGAVSDEARQGAEEESKRTRADVQLLTRRNLELRAEFGKLERAHSQAQSRLGELRDVETQHTSLQRAAQILQQSLLQMTGRFQDAETRRRRTEIVSRVLLVQVLQFRFCARKLRALGEKYNSLQVHAKDMEEENRTLNALRDTLMTSSKEHAIREARLESELAACKREANEVKAALQVAGARQNELEAERLEWLESLQRMDSQALQMETAREETRAEASRLRTLASQLDGARSELGERTRELRKGESALRKRVAVLELQQAKVDDAQAGLSQIQALTAQLRVQESANEVLRSRLGEAKPSHASPRPRMRLACDVATSPVRLRSSPPSSPTTSSKIVTKEAAVPTPTFLDVCKSEAGTQVDLVPPASIGNNQADEEASMAREALLRALEAKSSALEAKTSALENSLQQARAEKTALVAILTRTQEELLEE